MYIKYKRLLNGHTQIKIVVRQYWHILAPYPSSVKPTHLQGI